MNCIHLTSLVIFLLPQVLKADTQSSLQSYQNKFLELQKKQNEKFEDEKLSKSIEAFLELENIEKKYMNSGKLKEVLLLRKLISSVKLEEKKLLTHRIPLLPEVQAVIKNLKANVAKAHTSHMLNL